MYQLFYQNTKIKDLYKSDRPRERLIKVGAASLSNTELLAIILGSGYKGKNVIQLSNYLLKKYSLKEFRKVNYQNLIKEKGVGEAGACRILAGLELSKRISANQSENLPFIKEAKDAYEAVKEIGKHKKEYLVGLFLNARHQLIRKEVITMGLVNESLAHPREIFEPAILASAVAIILAHNHPSGSLEPSDDDIKNARQIVKVGEIIGIRVLDNLIVTNAGFGIIK
jgi:DNA repair protein RadC